MYNRQSFKEGILFYGLLYIHFTSTVPPDLLHSHSTGYISTTHIPIEDCMQHTFDSLFTCSLHVLGLGVGLVVWVLDILITVSATAV